MEQNEKAEERPKIEVVRVSSIERKHFRPLDCVQLRAAYSHIRIGTYCPEPEVSLPTCETKSSVEQSRKDKKNLGPVSRLLRRRHHATYLATKSCDNIYSINRNSNSLDWKLGQNNNDQGFQMRQSNSLDWRVGQTVNVGSNNLNYRNSSKSAEHLSRSLTSSSATTPSTKSKIVALLKRLSPRLPRPGSKRSLPTSPSAYPWIQVEYSTETVDGVKRGDSQESDVSFQKEIQMNELKKRMIKATSAYQMPSKDIADNVDCRNKNTLHLKVQIQKPEVTFSSCISQAVHEERGGGEERRSGGKDGRSEVAGLGEEASSAAASAQHPESGVVTGKPGRRTRPLSLAVQPLNYHRLEPETTATSSAAATIRHPNMTSQESIGSCSLDIDQSASDRSEATVGSLSEKTLHSLNLSCNGETSTSSGNLQNGSLVTIQQPNAISTDKANISNGHCGSTESEQLTAKKPSYLGLACSISGYSGITRYDSKLREGFRSRDSSPGTRLITRETSPAGFRSNEDLTVPSHTHPPKSQSISPLAMDRQNGFTNGMKETRKVESFLESRNSNSIYQGYSEVDKGMSNAYPDISPIRPNQKSPVKRSMATYSSHEISFSSTMSNSSPKSTSVNVSNTSFSDVSLLNGSYSETEQHNISNTSTNGQMSFIQQRVERLYGPGALAQGFFFKRSSVNKSHTSDSSFNKSSNSNASLVENSNAEESLKSLPVLRHLRPEFRAQLPVVSPRRPTDGSEQLAKSLRRITESTRKEETKETPSFPEPAEKVVMLNESSDLNSSITSLTDQQPAAPKVVLPVLEPSASSTNISKQAVEAKEVREEDKDGHYFMNLLEKERERLLTLAAAAEAELASGDPTALPEEAAGKLRSAAGKARLLASQKMHQFMGLCQKNINQVPGEEFPTTNEDLAGFWDMVMLQVVQVNKLFEQIERLRSSQWQEEISAETKKSPNSQSNNASKRRGVPHKAKPAANSEANRKAREAREQTRRQMLEERRRAMRSNAKNAVADSVEIFVPES